MVNLLVRGVDISKNDDLDPVPDEPVRPEIQQLVELELERDPLRVLRIRPWTVEVEYHHKRSVLY